MVSGQVSKWIGAAVKRKEDPRLITGEGKYTGDVQLSGMTYMAVLRSPHAHARIRRIETARARQQPGVLTVLTGQEVEPHCQMQFRLAGVREGMNTKSRWPMATEVAKYAGEPVAVVVATDRGRAQDALEMIEVDYESLPAVTDLEKAVEGGSPLVHEDLGTNLCVEFSGRAGDPDRVFREADGVVSARLVQPRLIPNPLEPRAVVASYERGTGNMTLWLSTQAPHLERSSVVDVLGFPENKLRVIAVDVGGGFGCKIDTYPETILAAHLSMQLARPVKWVEERQEHFLCTSHGRGEVQYVEAAYRQDGTLIGLRLRYYTDLGAYCNGGSHAVVGMLTPSGAPGVYRVRDLAWTSYGVYTNKVPVGPYRGYGQHATAYVIERVMDRIAHELKMDPVEVRRKNFITADAFPYQTPTGREYDSGNYEAVLDKALQLAAYEGLREEQRRLRQQGRFMGIGISTTVDASGFGPSSALSARPGYEGATVRVDPTSKVTVLTGSSPHGQGMETTFAQIAADELGVPFEDVEVVYGDTSITPRGSGTRASRSLVVGGTAIVKAIERVKAKAVQIAGALLHMEPQYVTLEAGKFFVEDIPDRSVTWADVSREAYDPRHLPRDLERGLEATAYWEPLAYTYPCSASVAVVYIDQETGEVKLSKYIYVDDCGTVVNPLIVDGQVHGGLAQGIGAALLEEAVWDDSGQLVTGSFMDYAMPSAAKLPRFALDRVVTPSPHNPLGAKGMGESPTIAAPPAIVNAVVDALAHLGVTHVDMPIKSEKVWRILREKGVAT
jgi:carbon-monoxide dehydrogenase large subunit